MTITDAFGLEHEERSGVSPFLKGIDFDGDGQILEVVGMEVFTPNDAKFGVKNIYGAGGIIEKENFLVKKGVCKEGQSIKWRFKQDGVDKSFDNYSATFFITMSSAKLEQGDKIKLVRTKGALPTDTKWNITKI